MDVVEAQLEELKPQQATYGLQSILNENSLARQRLDQSQENPKYIHMQEHTQAYIYVCMHMYTHRHTSFQPPDCL